MPDNIGVSGVCDGQGAHPEVLAARCAQLVVVSGVVVHTGLGQHGVVLDLRLSQGRRVAGNDHQLRGALPQGLESLLVYNPGRTFLTS